MYLGRHAVPEPESDAEAELEPTQEVEPEAVSGPSTSVATHVKESSKKKSKRNAASTPSAEISVDEKETRVIMEQLARRYYTATLSNLFQMNVVEEVFPSKSLELNYS